MDYLYDKKKKNKLEKALFKYSLSQNRFYKFQIKSKKIRKLVTITAVITSLGIVYNYIANPLENRLPYNNDQPIIKNENPLSPNEIEKETNDLYDSYSTETYNLLFDQVSNRLSKIRINLDETYDISSVLYNNLTNSLDVLLQNKENYCIVKFKLTHDDFANIFSSNETNGSKKFYDKISKLSESLSKAHFSAIPVFESKNHEINSSISNENVSCVLPESISYATSRDASLETLKSYEDYYFINYYKYQEDSLSCETIAISSTDYQILEIEDLRDFVLENLENELLVKGNFTTEDLEFSAKLNEINSESKNDLELQ